MSCPESETLIHTFVDGELTGSDRQVFERHMESCGDCAKAVRLQSRWKAAIRGHLSPATVPPEVRARVAAIAALPAATVAPIGRRRTRWVLATRVLPAAAAAGIMLVAFLTARERLSPVIEQAVSTHNKEIPLDVVASDCSSVAKWFRGKVDFNVAPDVFGKQVKCEGGRLVNVSSNKYGAFVRYRSEDGRRLSVLMVDRNDDEAIAAPKHRTVNGHDVAFGSAHGASTAAFKGRDNVWYVVTSDADEAGLNNVIDATFQPRAVGAAP